jgi:hypothetical protein
MSIYLSKFTADREQAFEDLKSRMFEKYPWLRKDLGEAIKAFIESAEKKSR